MTITSTGGLADDGEVGEGDNVADDFEILSGGSGDDTIDGGIGADTENGNKGDDLFIQVGAVPNGADTINGGLDVAVGANSPHGNGDNDRVDYRQRVAQIRVFLEGLNNDGTWDPNVNATTEGDNVGADGSVEHVIGGLDGDRLVGNGERNILEGGPGTGADALVGNAGNDRLFGCRETAANTFADCPDDDGADAMNGGSGNDRLEGGSNTDSGVGGDGADTVVGGTGNDGLKGDAGNDLVIGNDGDDLLRGGSGNDRLLGENGNDRLEGESGNDAMKGQAGLDALNGGSGNDVMTGDDGNDNMNGSTGTDTVYGNNGNDRVNIKDFRNGNDRAIGGAGSADLVRKDPGDSSSGFEGTF